MTKKSEDRFTMKEFMAFIESIYQPKKVWRINVKNARSKDLKEYIEIASNYRTRSFELKASTLKIIEQLIEERMDEMIAIAEIELESRCEK